MPSTPVVTDFSSFAGLRASAQAHDPAALKKAAQQFEAMMTQQLLKSARAASLSSDDVMGGGQTAYYQDMFDQQMALHLSTTGKGLGLADVLVRQVSGAQAGPAGEAASAFAHAPGLPQKASGAAGVEDTTGPSSSQADFIATIRPQAERAAKALGVPTHVILAQVAVETGWGRHVPKNADGSSSFNLFGIKAGASWSGDAVDKATHEYLGGRLTKVSARFRSYGSIAEAFDDYVKVLQSSPRYAQALKKGGTAAGFAHGLQQAGYATDPGYAGKLLKVAQGRTMVAALDPAMTRAATWTA